MDTSEEKTLRPVIAIAALLMAPLGSAMVVSLWFSVDRWVQYGHFDIYIADWFWVVPISFLFLAVGGPMVAVFWKRAPFGAVACAAVGAICGALAFYLIALSLSDVDDYAYFEREGRLLEYYWGTAQLILLGSVAGFAGGMTFWFACRLGSRPKRITTSSFIQAKIQAQLDSEQPG